MALLEACFVGSVLLGMLTLLFVGWKSPEIVVFLALVLVWNAGIVSTEDALSGFSNPGVLAVGSLFVVIKGVERSQLADKAAKHVFGLRTSFTAGLLRLMGLAFLLSAFLNNTPVVALLIPITKDWAATRGFSASLLLMPLSYACIFGGLITIIGTSTNLVVQGLVIEAGLPGLGFFEPGYIGLPLGMAGMLYLAVAAPRVLARAGGGGGGPGGNGGGGSGAGRDLGRTEELLTEVQVSHDFVHVGKSVALVLARLGLPVEALQPTRKGVEADCFDVIYPVSPLEPLLHGDVLVLSCPLSTMISFQGSLLSECVRGLEILGATADELQRVALSTNAASFLELVLSDSNHYVGRSPAGHDRALLANRYKCRVLAVRHTPTIANGRRRAEEKGSLDEIVADRDTPDRYALSSPLGQGGESVNSPLHGGGTQQSAVFSAGVLSANSDAPDEGTEAEEFVVRGVEPSARPLAPGDVVLVLAEGGFLEAWKDAVEFDLVTHVGTVPKAVATYDYLSLLVFCGMLGWVLFSSVAMVRAAFAAGGVLIVGGWVDPKRSIGYVDWGLLLLVGSALGLSKAIANSGLAGYAGNAIKTSGMSASASLYLLYGFTMICTELITNNAAAALAVPIALSIAKELAVSHKPFVLTVMLAASSSFITPIGYQTNTMVWAPGEQQQEFLASSTSNLERRQLGEERELRPQAAAEGAGEARRRALRAIGVPGEGLLLAVANSDEDAIDEFGHEGGVDESIAHKDLFPVNRWDIATTVLAACGLMIAAAGGIGGGGILVPIYILVLRFSPKYAVPLSNITIFGGAITNTFLNMKKRHPLADRPLVDWDLILVMEPLTIGGALVGSFIQKVLPEIVLTLSMVLLLLATADRTLRKGIKAFKKESNLNKVAEASDDLQAPTSTTDKANVALLGNTTKPSSSYGAASNGSANGNANGSANGTFPPAVLAPTSDAAIKADVETPEASMIPPTTALHSQARSSSDKLSTDKATALKRLLEEERHTSLPKVGIMTAVFVVLLTVNLLKGGGAFASPVGIECGSFAFWATSIMSFLYLIAVSFRVRQYLVNRWRLKAELGFEYVDGDVEWNPLNTVRYPCICFFAGFFAGMFGVGGGIVKGPLMIEMGVHPMVSASTSAVMILYTSFTATTSFIVFGLLKVDYAVPLFFLGLVATAVGQYGTDYLIAKFQRPSFIILSIGSVVALSAVLMGFNGLHDILNPGAGGGEDDGICSAGM
eukprot:g7469.t1